LRPKRETITLFGKKNKVFLENEGFYEFQAPMQANGLINSCLFGVQAGQWQ
jgi:hypothetical protein